MVEALQLTQTRKDVQDVLQGTVVHSLCSPVDGEVEEDARIVQR